MKRKLFIVVCFLITLKSISGQNIEGVSKPGSVSIITLDDSSIDFNIPISKKINENTFALIIGNEKYLNEIDVNYAANDATIFSKYAVNTLGLPNQNVHLIVNATLGQILGEIQWLTNITKAYNGSASLLIYYAGHGLPDELSKKSFLLPVDGKSELLQTAIELDWFYKELNKYPTNQITIFLDACFSGSSRNGMLVEGRGVKIIPKQSDLKGKIVVFSATNGGQTAHEYLNKQHGLFTYFLLKNLNETSGNNITLGSLTDYVSTNVLRNSVVNTSNPQNPTVNTSIEIQNTWRSLKIAY